MSREAEFVLQFLQKINQYLSKYSVGGRKLEAKGPDGYIIDIGGRVRKPDIVIVDERGIPQLIIEAKREPWEGKRHEEFIEPMGRAPVAQALCYAVLAMRKHNLSRTPLFATANRDVLILFKGISRDEVDEIVDVGICLEEKRSPEEWAEALGHEGYSKILKYLQDYIRNPLEEASIKRLFDDVEKLLMDIKITPPELYRIIVERLRDHVVKLHGYIDEGIKNRIDDKNYFIKLYNEAKEMGYDRGILSRGILAIRLVGPEEFRRSFAEIIGRELKGVRTAEDAYDMFSKLLSKSIAELCKEIERSERIDIKSISICQNPGTVRDVISFDNLSKMMAYVLANKILAYKILELHYGHIIPTLKAVDIGETVKVNNYTFTIRTPNDLKEYLKYLFSYISTKLERELGIRDFSPIFRTKLYDEVVFSGYESIDEVNAIIGLMDDLKHYLKELPGIIGYVYEGLLPPKERHQLGQFYTPPAIARLIAKWAIRSGNDKVLDAGCGSGTFLIESYKRLMKLKFNKVYGAQYPSCTERYNEHQDVLNNLYGNDINAFASHMTAIHLMLMEPRCPISKLNIETRDFFTIQRGSQAFGESIKGFDAVIGNPPYTRWTEIPDEVQDRIKSVLKNELKTYDLRADVRRGREPGIYIYWIMNASRLLNDGGRIGMIISNMWLQTDYGIEFGKFLLDNFRIRALIDLPLRLFEALISTVIVLLEKEPNRDARENNVMTLIRIPPKIFGEEVDVERASKILDEVLSCIESSIADDGSIDARVLTECQKKYGILFRQIKQSDMPRDRKWISLFFGVEDVVDQLERHPLMIRLEEWFEPSRGNSMWSMWAISHGKRPDLGAKDFFYFSRKKVDEWNRKIPGFRKAIEPYLVPAITRSQEIKTFTFTRNDWESIESSNKDAYLFVCHRRMDDLPEEVRKYIEWGERECRTMIRGTRGGGRICSEADACRARAEQKSIFMGWYDLGGYLPAPIMAIRQAFYHPQFFLCTKPVVTYDAIITFIPKVRIETGFMKVNPEDYRQYIPETKPNITLDEEEIKALLAYLNSTFNWLWIEQMGRRTGGGIIALEVNIARRMPILNVKAINRGDVKALARLFDDLETSARELAKEKEKMELFGSLKQKLQSIDRKIAEILNIPIDVEALWSSAWEMMERRVKGGRGPAIPGAEVYIDVDIEEEEGSSASSTIPLDRWFKRG